MTRKPLSPEATEALHNVMRKACERMEWRHLPRRTRKSKSDRALEMSEKGIEAQTICARLNIDIHSIHTMLRCAKDKRARWMGRLADEMGPNV